MSDTLDLVILDSGAPTNAVVFARCGPDVATAKLPFDQSLRELDDFRQVVEQALYGNEGKPTVRQLDDFGHKLFRYLIRGDVLKLYTVLPKTHVRILILSDCPTLQVIPWEYFQEPGQSGATRSVVRVVKTIGVQSPQSLGPSDHLRVLFAYANPLDQEARLDWDSVRTSIDQSLSWHRDKYTLDIVNEVTKASLIQTLNAKKFDIFHFSGHGTVVGGEGRLILSDGNQHSAYITSTKLADTLVGKGIRLVVLSACHGASGNFADDFSVIAKTLVERGIPAVVANQMPVYNDTMAPFVGTLYIQLLDHGDLDLAVHQGRLAIKNVFGDDSLAPVQEANLDWGVPTLYRHISAARMFEPATSK
jgi:hypothetical protein